MSAAPVLLCAAAVALLVLSGRRGWGRLHGISKAAAAASFVWAAVLWGALDSGYGRVVLAALSFGAAGDLLLLPRGHGRAFAAGMACFAAGHVAYAVAFAGRPAHALGGLGALVLLAAFAWCALTSVARGIPAGLRWPVRIYTALLVGMAALALGAWCAGGPWQAAAGALLFAASDVAVARARFLGRRGVEMDLGSAAYFGGQLLLAASVG